MASEVRSGSNAKYSARVDLFSALELGHHQVGTVGPKSANIRHQIQSGGMTTIGDSNAANSADAPCLRAPVHSSIFQDRVTIDNISMVVGASDADQAGPGLRD